MNIIAARDLQVGQQIVTAVYVRNAKGQSRTRQINEVREDDIITGIAKTLNVTTLVRGECGKGYHVNERRVRGKMYGKPPMPSPENGRVVTSDGCYDYALRLVVA